MDTNLSPELRQAIAEHPGQAIPLVDEQTGKTYYVCDEAFLFGDGETSELSRQQLKRLIDEGLQSGTVEKEAAHARMQATIDRHRRADS